MQAKKILCACLMALSFHLFGQEKSTWSLSFSAMPTVNWIGNSFNGSEGNIYRTDDHLLNQWNTQGVMIKKSKNSDRMSRYYMGYHSSNVVMSNNVYDDLSMSPNDLVKDSKYLSSSNFAFGRGVEKFQGDEFRLKYGLDITAMFSTGERAVYTYGNSFGEGNLAPISTLWGDSSVTGEAPQATRLSSSNSGSSLGLSINPFVGAEYFFKESISLGMEFHFITTFYTTVLRPNQSFTFYEPTSESLYQNTVQGVGQTSISSVPGLFGGGLIFTVYL